MRRRPAWLQLLVVCFAVLQTAMAPALTVLDARIADGRSPAASHVESERSRDCPPVHADECGVCRFLSHHVGLLDNPPPAIRAAALNADLRSTELRSAAARSVPPPTRAPPVVG